ncbi:hypothetical protein BC940DRAFT_287091 [Gongronella butleri]|nr:hypothetical protein BC940DRAFT_287091 [Gongronella butleri]
MDDHAIAGTRFTPPLWEQRRHFIFNTLKKHKSRKIVDYGCGEASVLSYLIPPSIENGCPFEHLIGLDIDELVLREAKVACQPWPADYTHLREAPLAIDLYQGSVDQCDQRIVDAACDAWICSEVIEHVHPPTLRGLRSVLFGTYAPPLVIITTPNAEYNVHFPNLAYGTKDATFRHDDHKFEWTRAEFQQWCEAIADDFGYDIEYHGIGLLQGKEDELEHGHCTQACVFTKMASTGNSKVREVAQQQPHQLVAHFDFPYYDAPPLPDNAIIEQLDTYLSQLCQAHTLEHDERAARDAQNTTEQENDDLPWPASNDECPWSDTFAPAPASAAWPVDDAPTSDAWPVETEKNEIPPESNEFIPLSSSSTPGDGDTDRKLAATMNQQLHLSQWPVSPSNSCDWGNEDDFDMELALEHQEDDDDDYEYNYIDTSSDDGAPPPSSKRTLSPAAIPFEALWSILHVRQVCQTRTKAIQLLQLQPQHYHATNDLITVYKTYNMEYR